MKYPICNKCGETLASSGHSCKLNRPEECKHNIDEGLCNSCKNYKSIASHAVLSEVRAAIQHELDRLPPDSDLTQYGAGFKAALTAIQNKISEHFR